MFYGQKDLQKSSTSSKKTKRSFTGNWERINVEKLTTKDEIENFWESVWGIKKDYNENAEWFKGEYKRCERLEQQAWEEKEGSLKITEIEINKNKQSLQLLVEHFLLHL